MSIGAHDGHDMQNRHGVDGSPGAARSANLGLDCATVERLLPLYPRGDLSREAFGAVTRHLVGCAGCRQALLDVQATYRLIQAHVHAVPASEAGGKAALTARLRATLPLAVETPSEVASEPRRASPVPPVGPRTAPPGRQVRDPRDEPPADPTEGAPVPALVPVRRRYKELPWPGQEDDPPVRR